MGDEHRRTVALLLDVAHDPRFALRGEELRGLAADVRLGGSRSSRWRGTDLLTAFAPSTTLRLRPSRRRLVARVLGLLAVALLVLPVWQAWMSFTEADGRVGVLLVLGLLFLAGAWALSRSAARVEAEDFDRGAARLAQAMTRASHAINAGRVSDPAEGAELLTEATAELIRAQQATSQTLQLLETATHRLEESAELLAHGTNAVGKSLGLHTGALQHQISELTQVRASLERISGLALSGEDGRTPTSA